MASGDGERVIQAAVRWYQEVFYMVGEDPPRDALAPEEWPLWEAVEAHLKAKAKREGDRE